MLADYAKNAVFVSGNPVFRGLLPKPEYFSRALYTFDIGQNDLAAGYFHNLTVDQVKGNVPDIVNQFKSVVKVIDYFGHSYIYIYIYKITEYICMCIW